MQMPSDAPAFGAFLTTIVVLPGAWLTFVPRLREVDFGERFALAIALSPLVIIAEFYALRFAGVSFEDVVRIVPWANAPAALAILWRMRVPSVASLSCFGVVTVALAAPVYLLSWRYIEHDPSQVFTAHALIHTDIIYMLAGGMLVPEEAELAGVSIGYHWLGHVQPALLAARANAAPPWIYLYMNLAWLAAVVVFCVKGARHLGARTAGAVTAVLLVLLGVNAAGYTAGKLLPDALVERLKLDGLGWTFTPWLWKFQMFNQVTVGLAMFAAVFHVSLKGYWSDLDRRHLALAAAALLSLGLVYPVMFPIGGAAAGLAWIFALSRDVRAGSGVRFTRYAAAAVVMVITTAAVVANLELITADRSGDAIRLFETRGMAKKAYDLTWTFVPFAIVLAVLRVRRDQLPGVGARFCVLASAVSLASYVFLGVGALTAENKFIFTAAVTLGPPAALALQRWFDRIGPATTAVVVVAAMALLPLPLAHKCDSMRDAYAPPQDVDSGSFHLRLAEGEKFAAAAQAIVERTPSDAVVVSFDADVHLPSFVRRAAYAPTRPSEVLRGVGLKGGLLLVAVRGQSAEFVENRLARVRALYRGEAGPRGEAFSAIVADVDRTVAFVLELPRDEILLEWLEENGGGTTIHRDVHVAVHFVD